MRKFKALIMIWAFVAIFFTGITHATIIDNNHYTTINGLDWLDWSITRGLTQTEALNKYRKVPGYGTKWRSATHSETVNMLDELNGSTLYWGSTIEANGSLGFDLLFKAINLLGQTTDPSTHYSDRSRALIEGLGFYGAMEDVRLAGYLPGTFGTAGYSDLNTGVALVRVPAPSSLLLFIFAIFASVFISKCKRTFS